MMDNATYVTLTDANFEQEVGASSVPVLVDFGAVWCPPCRVLEPLVEEVASEYQGTLKVGKMDIDENPEAAMTYGIRGVPTILFFRDGQVVDRIVGAVPKSAIVDKVKQLTAV
jgi:thioredoxin 1